MYWLDRIKLNVIDHKAWWFTLSGVLLLAGLIALATHGLNLGIDFKGGSIVQRSFETKVTAAQVQDALTKAPLSDLKLGSDTSVQPGSGNAIIIRTRALTPAEEKQLDQGLEQLVGHIDRAKDQTDTVGPVVGRELTQNAFLSVVVASLLILVYVSFRFEFKAGVAAVIALLHDIAMIMGVFAITGKQVDSPFVAAILTISGYSMMDTIVVYDRIRENVRQRKKGEKFGVVVNNSINQVLARWLNTVGVTLVSILALNLFGGESIKTFTFALLFGIASGAYSSIFIASPLWVVWEEWVEKRKAARMEANGKRLAGAKAR